MRLLCINIYCIYKYMYTCITAAAAAATIISNNNDFYNTTAHLMDIGVEDELGDKYMYIYIYI
jgi:hypothetical protein